MQKFEPTIENLAKYKRDFKYVISSFHMLNIQAKYMRQTPVRRIIYQMKEYYTDYLYVHGLAVCVNKEIQTIRCNNALHKMGYDWKCGDCGGTGRFAANAMFAYHFKIEEVQFSWHQPCHYAITVPYVSIRPMPTQRSYYLHVRETNLQDLLYISWRFLLMAGYGNLCFIAMKNDDLQDDKYGVF